MPQLSSLHIDQALTTISIKYTNEEFVAPILMPEVKVQKRSDKYFVYGKENLKVVETLRRPKSEANEVDWTVSQDAYFCEEHSLRDLVADAEKQIADAPLMPEIDATEFLTERVMLDEEVQVANLLTSNTNLTQYTALSGTSQWSDYVNSTPFTTIKTAKAAVRASVLKAANTFFTPYEVALVLADHPSVKQLIQYTDPNALSETGLPPVIRGLRVVEGAVMQNTANEGQAASLASIWGKNAIVCYLTGAPRLKSISLGYAFIGPDDTTGVAGWSVRKYRDEKRKGDIIEVSKLWDNKIIAAGAGYLIQTVIA